MLYNHLNNIMVIFGLKILADLYFHENRALNFIVANQSTLLFLRVMLEVFVVSEKRKFV